MMLYINKILTDFLKEIIGTMVTPAADYLFDVGNAKDATKLPNKHAIACHHYVEKLLFIKNNIRQNIQTPDAFLAKWVKELDEDDWGKLR